MTIEIFITTYMILAIADWWMTQVQLTTTFICRASKMPIIPIGELLNPPFIKFSFPITLALWALVIYWAWHSSVVVALSVHVVTWLLIVVSPLPARLTLPMTLKQIARVYSVDKEKGEQLLLMVEQWKSMGMGYIR